MTEKTTPEEFYSLRNISLTEDDLDNLMFMGTVPKVEEFLKAADNCVGIVKDSRNIRLMILETWLFLDYSVRELLIIVIGGGKINREEYELRYYALPSSFRACVDLLVKIKTTNEKLVPDPKENAITFPIKFGVFLMSENREFFKQFRELEQTYYRRYYPELATPQETDTFKTEPARIDFDAERNYRYVSETWLTVTRRLDDTWKKRAYRLNNARNHAAHSYEYDKISKHLGYSGVNVEKLVRDECLTLIEQLVGITPKR